MLAQCIRPKPHRLRSWKCRHTLRWHPPQKRWASSAPISLSNTEEIRSDIEDLKTELDQIAPRIDIRADQVRVLRTPEEFYETLKHKIRGAKKRIYLSTLYIGKSENELVSSIQEAVLKNGPNLRVSILTDALRGTRESPSPSCASLLASLAVQFPDQIEIRMYHTPNLTGLRKRLVPKRINEGWGLQHIKLYGFDDEIILSGANLSSDYFTNRQDRYHIFSSKRVADYFARIHHGVCSVSFRLLPTTGEKDSGTYSLSWPSSNPAPSPLIDPAAYIKVTTKILLPLASPSIPPQPPSSSQTVSVYPLLCHPPTLNNELPVIRAVLSYRMLSTYTFTAGYFNPHPLVTSALLSCPAIGKVLTASPSANGFYKSAGVSGLLPSAYTHLSLRFLQAVRKANANIQLREWQRGTVGQPGGWTYHAKGLWTTLTDSSSSPSSPPYPNITLLGSSNYTKRSYTLDLEVGALLVTRDPQLMRQWHQEQAALLEPSRRVQEQDLQTNERRAGWRVRLAMWIVTVLGGAL